MALQRLDVLLRPGCLYQSVNCDYCLSPYVVVVLQELLITVRLLSGYDRYTYMIVVSVCKYKLVYTVVHSRFAACYDCSLSNTDFSSKVISRAVSQ